MLVAIAFFAVFLVLYFRPLELVYFYPLIDTEGFLGGTARRLT
jgi:hypothetical protein